LPYTGHISYGWVTVITTPVTCGGLPVWGLCPGVTDSSQVVKSSCWIFASSDFGCPVACFWARVGMVLYRQHFLPPGAKMALLALRAILIAYQTQSTFTLSDTKYAIWTKYHFYNPGDRVPPTYIIHHSMAICSGASQRVVRPESYNLTPKYTTCIGPL